jgi:hypothetical protein
MSVSQHGPYPPLTAEAAERRNVVAAEPLCHLSVKSQGIAR